MAANIVILCRVYPLGAQRFAAIDFCMATIFKNAASGQRN
jgi:hypothetical protein